MNLVNRYVAGENSYQIASSAGCNPSWVIRLVRKAGQRVRTNAETKRKYQLREDCFDSWNDDSAYWTGFLTADGHIPTEGWTIIVRLAEADRLHLEALQKFLGRDDQIKTYTVSTGHRACSMSFSSRHMVNRLHEAGLRKRNATVICPELATNPNYWRGVVDGDGTIAFKTNSDEKSKAAFKVYPNLRLYGGRDLLSQFLSFAKSIAPWASSSVLKHKNIWVVILCNEVACEVLKHLYPPNCTALERKRIKAQGLISAVQNWQANRLRKRRKSSDCEKRRWAAMSAK